MLDRAAAMCDRAGQVCANLLCENARESDVAGQTAFTNQ